PCPTRAGRGCARLPRSCAWRSNATCAAAGDRSPPRWARPCTARMRRRRNGWRAPMRRCTAPSAADATAPCWRTTRTGSRPDPARPTQPARASAATPGQACAPAGARIVACAGGCYAPTSASQGQGMHRRDFIGAAAMAALAPFAGLAAVRAAAPARLLPRPLSPGDTVALVSPSSAVADPFDLQLAREVMEALGLRVVTGAHYAQRRGHLAGPDA